MSTLTATPRGSATGRASGSARPRSLSTLVFALWIACGAVIVVPLTAVVMLALSGGDFSVLLEEDMREAAVNSVVSATISGLFAVAFGTALAILFDRTDLPGRNMLRLFALSPMLVPPFVGAIAWLGVLGPASPLNRWWASFTGAPLWSLYGGDGVIFLLTVHSYPLAMLIMSAALRRIPSDLEQAARISGAGPARALTTVTLPLLRPALLSSFVLITVGNLADFGIPSIIGLPERFTTLSTLVYRYLQSATVDSPLTVVATIGSVLLTVAVLSLVLDAVISARGRRGVQFDVTGTIQRTPLGRWRRSLGMIVAIVVLGLTVLPLCALAMQALIRAPGLPFTMENITLDHFVTAISSSNTMTGATNSIMLALGAALVCMVLGLAVGVVTTRTTLKSARGLQALTLVPQAIPGLVIAVAWLIIAPRIGLFNTPWLILCAYVTSFIALVVQAVVAPLQSTAASAEESARIAGAGPVRALWDISARMALPAALSGGVIVAVTAVRELTLSVLLLSPGSQTLGVVIFNLQQAGAFGTAAALSLLVALLGIAVIGFATRSTARS
ncbi:ABC transporter permease [Microbacterium sp. NC79]|uniref:ABC transporter permease n=1 Tax=Microbacterium sp. NC79 TaxID=2851009 RepID=UPI00349F2A03